MDRRNKNLLWDLGNTLVKIDGFSFARRMGLIDMFLYPLIDRANPKDLIHRTMDLLETIDYPNDGTCNATLHGRPLPPLLCHWLEGKISNEEARTYLQGPLMQNVPKEFFNSRREERLVEMILKTLTTPEVLASSMRIIQEGIDLLKECSEQYDEHGNQLHTLYILSNWDPDSFEHITKTTHLKDLFTYFEKSNLIISGNIGHIKPHDELYSYIIKTYQLNPPDCILIDDQTENIIGAQKHGMLGILLEDGNYQQVREQLQQYRII